MLLKVLILLELGFGVLLALLGILVGFAYALLSIALLPFLFVYGFVLFPLCSFVLLRKIERLERRGLN